MQSALDAAPRDSARPWRIQIRRGVWTEKLTVAKPNIHLVGESRRGTVLSFGAWAGQISPDGQPWGTRRSATLTVTAPGFAAENLTIRNSFDPTAPRPPGATAFQAVALALTGGSDRALLRRVDIEGFQDTLLTDAGRSLFENCRISGTVDFIFGAGTAFLDRCDIVSRHRQMPGEGRMGYIAAPSTNVERLYGLIFNRCRLTAESGVPAGSIALGRAWRPTTTFADGRYGDPKAVGQAVYLNCWMGAHIDAAGWDRMFYNSRDGGRAALEPADARFFEYHVGGPGGRTHPARRTLADQDAARFSRHAVLGAGYPFTV